eukprot:TRINITY_DN3250_c4_g4_i1.p1 TRINITY_DN3250_c4_g4~~TRINITY_DN3250_c4_g4_i1.p1  ORF type:complete len:218 (+),score=51.30 TRINITY_DN3250_c4_g4_i1:65-718(+)
METTHSKLKVLIVGDLKSGKTSLLTAFLERTFGVGYKATSLFSNEDYLYERSGENFIVTFWDIAGQFRTENEILLERNENNEQKPMGNTYLPLLFHDSHCVILCIDSQQRRGWNNSIDFWMKLIECHLPPVIPVICTITKKDSETITKDDIDFVKSRGFEHVILTSSKLLENVDNLFFKSIELAFEQYSPQQHSSLTPRFEDDGFYENEKQSNCCFL